MRIPPHVLCVIPARFASTRLHGKALLHVDGEPMIAHVIRAARAAANVHEVLVATDHDGIARVARAEGVDAIMTDSALPSGTDRVAAALLQRGAPADVVVNVQCDEPRIEPAAIELVSELLLRRPAADMSTLSAPLDRGALLDINRVKVVCCPEPTEQGAGGAAERARVFSRAPIGVDRELMRALLQPEAHVAHTAPRADAEAPAYACRLHVGLYAFRPAALHKLVALPPSPLEVLERLEQLRALEAGMHIVVGRVASAPHGVDTEDDLRAVQAPGFQHDVYRRRA
jgi:3-deoxy-manno-octulosonate cytidylyltransferase (CMP-KDO synthetase)